MKTGDIVYLIGVLIIIIGSLVGLFYQFTVGSSTEQVPCYDRYSNIIQDQICISENNWGLGILALSVLLGVLIIWVSIIAEGIL